MCEESEAIDDLLRLLVQQHRVAEPKRPTPRYRKQDLVQNARLNPDDWQKLRVATEWTESERRQMDADCKRLGEDHAYHIWRHRWLDKWK